MKSSLIAPCGMNCNICLGYLRDKNKCPGCAHLEKRHPPTRTKCRIRSCDKLKKKHIKYCFSCDIMPCARLKHLDKRYRTRYGMSMLENLARIKRSGIKKFLAQQENRWTCRKCGGIICVHRGYCYTCKKEKLPGKSMSPINIGCCGFYCKLCKEFTSGLCAGCRLGYATGKRDIKKAKCKIKLCCFKKGFITCADCNRYASCKLLQNRFTGYKLKKCLEITDFIRKNGYGKFIKTARTWKNCYGKLK